MTTRSPAKPCPASEPRKERRMNLTFKDICLAVIAVCQAALAIHFVF